MIQLILSAVGLGIMISLVLIGPVFFLLIETSISKGVRSALALDMGVILGDVLCIMIAYYSSYDLLTIIDDHPGFYRITAFIILIYGLMMVLTKTKTRLSDNQEQLVSKNYLRTFANGFILNMLNIGVVVFWIITVISIRAQYKQSSEFFLYIGIVIATFFIIDLLKIFLASSFKSKVNDATVSKIRRIVGGILIAFSLVLFLKSLGCFKKWEDNNYNKPSTHHTK